MISYDAVSAIKVHSLVTLDYSRGKEEETRMDRYSLDREKEMLWITRRWDHPFNSPPSIRKLFPIVVSSGL